MKKQTLILTLIVLAVLLTVSGSSFSDVHKSISVSNVLSGGQYMLTIHSTTAPQPTGYRWLDTATADDPALGCCCKTYAPCAQK
jgi:hypothetical protein